MKRTQWSLCFALVALALASTVAFADSFSTVAFDNATVQPIGPRPGPNGKNFYNAEGNNNLDFASFAPADFDSTMLVDQNGNPISYAVGSVNSVTLILTQANAAFSHDGAISFYVSEDTTTSIQPDDVNPAVTYDATSLPDGIGSQLTPIHVLGGGNYVQGMSGDADTFSFTPDDATSAYLANAINNGGTIRVVVSPGDLDVSATYAGFSNDTYTGPMLILDVNPAQ
jgi:hypothetical protein